MPAERTSTAIARVSGMRSRRYASSSGAVITGPAAGSGMFVLQPGDAAAPVWLAAVGEDPRHLAPEWHLHSVALRIVRPAALPGRGHDLARDRAAAVLGAHDFDQSVDTEAERERYLRAAIGERGSRTIVVDRRPLHALARQQCGRIPGRF